MYIMCIYINTQPGWNEEWDPDLLPWNRRQRRAHARRGVAIHLFSGSDTKKWIRPEVGDWEWIFIDTCLGSQFDLHRPVVISLVFGVSRFGEVGHWRTSMPNR